MTTEKVDIPKGSIPGKEIGRKFKDGWWTSVGRQSLSKRPPGAIPSLLRQSDLWARAVAAAAEAQKPPSKARVVKARIKKVLGASWIGGKTSPSDNFPTGVAGNNKSVSPWTAYAGCFGPENTAVTKPVGKKKRSKEVANTNCCSVTGRTLWSSSERVWVNGSVQSCVLSTVTVEEDQKKKWKVGEVGRKGFPSFLRAEIRRGFKAASAIFLR